MTKPDPYPRSLLGEIQAQLAEVSQSPYLDGLVLLARICGLSKSQLLAEPNPDLDRQQRDQLSSALAQLQNGIPLPYVLGEWEFYRLAIKVTPEVLIPRPETEGLVELALAWLEDDPGRRDCLEVGTGSGCIAVALAANHPALRITASDISPAALAVARQNAIAQGAADRIQLLESDLLAGIQGTFDLLIANLPYIPTPKLLKLPVLRTEPRLALDGGPNGLSLIDRLLQEAPGVLKPGALVLLELDEDRGGAARELAERIFPDAVVQLRQDLAGFDRYLMIET